MTETTESRSDARAGTRAAARRNPPSPTGHLMEKRPRRRDRSEGPAKKLRVLMLMDKDLVPPDDATDLSPDAMQAAPWKMEYDVFATLHNLGHEVRKLGVHDDLNPIRDAITEFKPHVAFNLLEGFRDFHGYDQHVVSYLELIEQPYTGCNPRGLTLARDKALTKKLMAYHRIPAPAFAVFPRRRPVVRPKGLKFPLLVKSVNVEGSIGIVQASIVWDDEQLRERVRLVHEQLDTSAIAEQYIEGRELYVGVMGNGRLKTFPAWELLFENAPEGMPLIATNKAKFDTAYQKRWGITTRAADNLPDGLPARIDKLCKRIYRVLGLTGYARLDFRLTPEGQLYLLEANPNPQVGYGEDFSESAEAVGVGYDKLIQQILNLGLSYSPTSLS
jgi:D-alanine-D-alanine ligase